LQIDEAWHIAGGDLEAEPRSSAASATTPGMRPASIGFLKTLSIPIVGPIGTRRRRFAVTRTTREKV
jgi:hypothetical protein